MKLLLHICCAPCAIYPMETLMPDKFDVMGYFYGHNIHPYSECLKRRQTLESYASRIGLTVIYADGYDIENFLRNVAFREADRCTYCYHERLRCAALVAKRGKFDCFSSTLLYSKFQNHDAIRTIGVAVGKSVGVPFHYQDFRSGWKHGVEASKEMKMYRQSYCGCIYSEKERYLRNKPQQR